MQLSVNELVKSLVRQEMSNAPKSATLPIGVYYRDYDVTPEAVRQRLSKGVWRLGHHVLDVKGAGRFVDLDAIDKWVRQQGSSTFHAE